MVQGTSLVPLLRGDTTAIYPCVFAAFGQTQRMIRTDRWKLIHYPNAPHGELYDMRNDPEEFENLWEDPKYGSIREEMRILLLEKLSASEDPLPQRAFDW